MDNPAPSANVPPANNTTEPANDAGFGGFDGGEEKNDMPFDKEPFDAGIDVDEDSDPKKFIEQLSGKLGQSLRKYNQENGAPDFDLEKFAINSVISATHTSEMDDQDRKDIIKKVNTAGNNEAQGSGGDSQDDTDFENDNNDGDVDITGDNNDFDFSSDDEELGEVFNKIYETDNLFLDEPKRNNMFQPNSNDILNNEIPTIAENTGKNLINSEKNSIFDKNELLKKLHESLNLENMEIAEPQVKPQTKPAETQPLHPSRRQKTFLPEPATQPDPKAKK